MDHTLIHLTVYEVRRSRSTDFGAAFCLHLHGIGSYTLNVDTRGSAETPVMIYLTTRCHIPEDNKVHNQCLDNLKPHIQVIWLSVWPICYRKEPLQN
jgi:hypothetical protein